MHADKDSNQPGREDSPTDQAYRGGGDVISRGGDDVSSKGGGDVISKGGGDLISKNPTSQPPEPEPDNDSKNAASARTPY